MLEIGKLRGTELHVSMPDRPLNPGAAGILQRVHHTPSHPSSRIVSSRRQNHSTDETDTFVELLLYQR